MAAMASALLPLPPSPPSSLRSAFAGLSLSLHLRTPVASRFPLSSSSSSSSPIAAPLPIVAHAGYKMKTHHASAKRFRVTGSGKIICRRAAKQHLLWKKNTKRRKRLSKMALVEKADYENITHALPYLKVAKK